MNSWLYVCVLQTFLRSKSFSILDFVEIWDFETNQKYQSFLHNIFSGILCDLFTRHKISKPLKVPLPCNINLRCHQRNILSHNASAAGLSVEDVVGLPESVESWNLRSKEFVLMPTSPALLTFKVHSCATQALGNITPFDVEPLILAPLGYKIYIVHCKAWAEKNGQMYIPSLNAPIFNPALVLSPWLQRNLTTQLSIRLSSNQK